MSFDGVVTRAMVNECNVLLSGRVVRIYQPSDWEIILYIRSQGTNYGLLLSVHPVYARLQLLKEKLNNPSSPPHFCMLLRKHLENSIVKSISQKGLERIVTFTFIYNDILGNQIERHLVLEIMGKHSNLILLTDGEPKVIDAIKRIPLSISRHRQLYPGSLYIEPPAQDKLNPLTVEQNIFLAGFDYCAGHLHKQIVQRFQGIGPLLARSMVEQFGIGSRSYLWEVFSKYMMMVNIHLYTPNKVVVDGKTFFHVMPLMHLKGDHKTFDTVSDCLADCYDRSSQKERCRQQAASLLQVIEQLIARQERKIIKLCDLLHQRDDLDKYRIYGELLTSYLHQIKKGDSHATLPNYYEPESPKIEIPLKMHLTATENATYYFQKYRKLKRSFKWHEQQLEKAQIDKNYLDSLVTQLEQHGDEQVSSIREELSDMGFVRKIKEKHKLKKDASHHPLVLNLPDGQLINIGRNNRQNDYLTHRLAKSWDIWFHTQNIPGAHVVLRRQGLAEISDDVIIKVALLAAYFSKARDGSNVPVDYTRIKYVKKPSNFPPGFVTYSKHKTVFVTPAEDEVKQMLHQRKI